MESEQHVTVVACVLAEFHSQSYLVLLRFGDLVTSTPIENHDITSKCEFPIIKLTAHKDYLQSLKTFVFHKASRGQKHPEAHVIVMIVYIFLPSDLRWFRQQIMVSLLDVWMFAINFNRLIKKRSFF